MTQNKEGQWCEVLGLPAVCSDRTSIFSSGVVVCRFCCFTCTSAKGTVTCVHKQRTVRKVQSWVYLQVGILQPFCTVRNCGCFLLYNSVPFIFSHADSCFQFFPHLGVIFVC